MRKINIFYSYSHKDEQYREELETHLSVLKKQGFINEWHDRRISAGSDWEEEINFNLEEADMILLLVSSNFLASDYCYDTETIRALDKDEAKEAIVVPVILSPCLWRESKLRKLQSLPRDDKPVSTFSDKNAAWLQVAEGILAKVKELRKLPVKDTEKHLDRTSLSPKFADCDLVLKFLEDFKKWYFSPLRIQKWGSRQTGYSELSSYTTNQIRECLEKQIASNKVKTILSQKGNVIYRHTG